MIYYWKKGNDPRETIVNSTYPDLLSNYRERVFLQERAILCPRNDIVQEINEYIMDQITGEEMIYIRAVIQFAMRR
jgi:ATP-dependent DNA helicase PIF1